MHRAASTNDVDLANYILATSGEDLTYVNMKVEYEDSGVFNTPIDIATYSGFINMVKLLVRKGKADPDIKDSNGFTATFGAAQLGHLELLKFLVEEANSEISQGNGGDHTTPIFSAVINNRTDIVSYLADKVENVDRMNSYKCTPLFGATWMGNIKMVEDLVLIGNADVNLKNTFSGWTAAMLAAKNGSLDILYFLTSVGEAEIKVKSDSEGSSALSMASIEGHTEVVEYLLSQDQFDIDSKDNAGCTPLFHAAKNGHFGVVKLLLEQGADVNSKNDWYKTTPLIAASTAGHTEIVRYLLKNGGDLNVDYLNLKKTFSSV